MHIPKRRRITPLWRLPSCSLILLEGCMPVGFAHADSPCRCKSGGRRFLLREFRFFPSRTFFRSNGQRHDRPFGGSISALSILAQCVPFSYQRVNLTRCRQHLIPISKTTSTANACIVKAYAIGRHGIRTCDLCRVKKALLILLIKKTVLKNKGNLAKKPTFPS